MPLITFTSDFGNGDHYVAAVKAAMLNREASVRIIDLSHDIRPYDVPHLAFTINSVFRLFPKGTIHLIGINNTNSSDQYLAVELEDHVFLLPDNGLVGLLSNQQPSKAVILKAESPSLFPACDLLAPIALAIYKGAGIDSFGESTSEYLSLVSRKVKAIKKEISGHIIHVDHFGNLISNIKKIDFDILSKDKTFKIRIGKNSSNNIHQKYQEVDPGEIFYIFNNLGFLEIGINQGNGSQLLGLGFDVAVNIQFEE